MPDGCVKAGWRMTTGKTRTGKTGRRTRSHRRWKFSELLADPAVKARWEKVRKYFFLRESTYDMSNRCNLRCDGCYYYEGDKAVRPGKRRSRGLAEAHARRKRRAASPMSSWPAPNPPWFPSFWRSVLPKCPWAASPPTASAASIPPSATGSISPSGGMTKPASGSARPGICCDRQIDKLPRRSPGRLRLYLYAGKYR